MRNAHRSPGDLGDRAPRRDNSDFGKGSGKCRAHKRIPLAVKLIYTLFVSVLVFNYWRAYSPEIDSTDS